MAKLDLGWVKWKSFLSVVIITGASHALHKVTGSNPAGNINLGLLMRLVSEVVWPEGIVI